MGTICTWQRAKALRWRRAVREAACRQAAGDVSASWMPPHALCPWIYGCATVGPDPPPAWSQRAPWCPVQLASWSCSALLPTSWKGAPHTGIQCTYTHTHEHTTHTHTPGQITSTDAHAGQPCRHWCILERVWKRTTVGRNRLVADALNTQNCTHTHCMIKKNLIWFLNKHRSVISAFLLHCSVSDSKMCKEKVALLTE